MELKCCVGGCNATNANIQLFCLPRNDYLRSLWLNFLVPTNPQLAGLSKKQLLYKPVCKIHFDKHQFDAKGRRLRFSYPCLFSNKEIAHGMPFNSAKWSTTSEHNYCVEQSIVEGESSTSATAGSSEYVPNEHNYCSQQNVVEKTLDAVPSSSKTDESTMSTQELPTCSRQQNKNEDSSVLQKQYCQDTTNNEVDTSLSQNVSNLRKRKQTRILTIDPKTLPKFNMLNKYTKTFMLMQLNQLNKKKMGRRFTLDEKLLAMAIYKQSPKAYKLLERMFTLPSKRTLSRLSQNLQFEAGFNPQIFKHIHQVTNKWDTKKSFVLLYLTKWHLLHI